jgi:predicted DNA-binding protein
MYKTMTDIKKPIPPFMFRLRPEYRKLLDQTSDLERRSRASILEELIKKHLPQRVKEGSEDLHETK